MRKKIELLKLSELLEINQTVLSEKKTYSESSFECNHTIFFVMSSCQNHSNKNLKETHLLPGKNPWDS